MYILYLVFAKSERRNVFLANLFVVKSENRLTYCNYSKFVVNSENNLDKANPSKTIVYDRK